MPTVPTAPTVSPAVSSTTQMNLFRDAINFALAPPHAELRQTAAQSISSAVAAVILFDTEDVDTDVDGVGGHSTSSNTSRYTARYPGWYEVSGGVSFAASATNRRLCWWRVNGVDMNASEGGHPGSAAGTLGTVARTKLVYLAIGDYVELVAFQDSGGALLTQVVTFEQPSMKVTWKSM